MALAGLLGFGSAGDFRYGGYGIVTLYFSSGYMVSLRGMPSSSRIGSSSWRYSWYWFLFSTLNLTPIKRVSNQEHLNGRVDSVRLPFVYEHFSEKANCLKRCVVCVCGIRTLENADG